MAEGCLLNVMQKVCVLKGQKSKLGKENISYENPPFCISIVLLVLFVTMVFSSLLEDFPVKEMLTKNCTSTDFFHRASELFNLITVMETAVIILIF